MSALDKLFDLMSAQSQWTSFSPPVTFELVKVETVEEMAIVIDATHGPMLEIRLKNPKGVLVSNQRLNLPAVDDLVGRLIKMRDHMAAMTPEER